MNSSAMSDLGATGERAPTVTPTVMGWLVPRAFAVLCLFCCTQGPVFHLRFKLDFPDGFYLSDPLVVLGYTGLWAIAIAYAWSAREAIRSLGLALYLPLLFCAYALASSMWSEQQPRTIIYSVLLTGTTAFALWFGTYFSTVAQIAMIFCAMQLGSLLSLIAVSRGSFLSLDVANNWTGIYINRNSLAPVAALGLASTAALLVIAVGSPELQPRLKVGLLLPLAALAYIDVLLIHRSHSATSIGGLIAAICAAALYGVWRLVLRRGARQASSRLVTLAHISFLTGLLAAWSLRHRLIELALRDPTINGRTKIWAVVLDWIHEEPWFGHGWMSVWGIPERQALVATIDNPTIPFAHNGILEAALGMGWPGAFVLVITMALILLLASERLLRGDSWIALWGLAMIVYSVFVSQFEGFFDANQIPWILAIAAGASAAHLPAKYDRTHHGASDL